MPIKIKRLFVKIVKKQILGFIFASIEEIDAKLPIY